MRLSQPKVMAISAVRIHMPLRICRQYMARGSSSIATAIHRAGSGHDDGAGRQQCQLFQSELEMAGIDRRAFIFVVVPLILHARHVDRVGFRDHRTEIVGLHNPRPSREGYPKHRCRSGADQAPQNLPDAGIVGQQVRQRAHRPAATDRRKRPPSCRSPPPRSKLRSRV